MEMAIEATQIKEANEIPLKEMQVHMAAVETAAQPLPPPGSNNRCIFRSSYGARRLQYFTCGQYDHLARNCI
jgi:hypothetical protein